MPLTALTSAAAAAIVALFIVLLRGGLRTGSYEPTARAGRAQRAR